MGKERNVPRVLFFLIENGGNNFSQFGVRSIADKGATWDVFVAWQRGKVAAPVRALIDALDLKSQSKC
jgi:hypothetical protein